MFEGHPLFSMENVYRAYRRCRRHKRGTINALRFERNLEENLVALHEELTSGTYRPGRSVAFLIEKPKRREIFAADFRDRVVHHILVGHLEPKWERRFIHDSYACRKGKGTHAGVERLRSFTRQVTANGTRPAWYLQLDVRGYFIALNREILFERVVRRETDPAVLWLARTLIFHEPTENCRMRGSTRADFEGLPAHKTLFRAEPNCGLPIGNLTSQFFANVYLDALDQFVKHTLKAQHYVRYCDDLVLLAQGQDQLAAWEQRIVAFAEESLKLQLNARRRLRPVADGIDFLGYIVRPSHLLARRRVVGAFRERLEDADATLRELGAAMEAGARKVFVWHWPTVVRVQAWLNSYLGHFGRASCRRLLVAMRRRFVWLDEFFCWNGASAELRCPVPRRVSCFAQQKQWFVERLPGHALVVQRGRTWELLPGPICDKAETWAMMSLLARRFPQRQMQTARRLLWDARLPVGWISETGGRVGLLAERALTCRWDAEAAAIAA